MTRNRLRIVTWAAAIALVAGGVGYALRLDHQNRSILKYMEAGHMAEHCGDLRAAAADYARALSVNGTYLPARIALADVHLANDDDRGALEILRRGVAADPKNAEAYTALARALVECHRYPDAIRYLKRAVEIAPRDPYIRRLLSYCYRQHGKIAEANRRVAEID